MTRAANKHALNSEVPPIAAAAVPATGAVTTIPVSTTLTFVTSHIIHPVVQPDDVEPFFP